MNKKLFLVLGNGFSIDLLTHANLINELDVINLFNNGSEVYWPGNNTAGFLSYRHCPNLWNLGARPNMTSQESMSLLEDIITCVNVYALRNMTPRASHSDKPNDIYIKAYHELSIYLRTLFSFYNNKIDTITDKLSDWPWLNYLKEVSSSNEYSEIIIVTYNYDIWLERILRELDIPHKVSMIHGGDYGVNPKIKILKPHGSISFYHTTQQVSEFNIPYDREILSDAVTDDFIINYDIPDSRCLVNAMIPPAGDSERFKHTWAGQIKQSVSAFAGKLKSDDDLMFCGLSYWHVDRSEIDDILIKCSSEVNVYLFNPKPNPAFNAVLTSMFSNYVFHTNSNALKGRCKRCQ
ncbi:hypothetical protein [Photobacterium kishitanii]|uniref:hypothetical protein n=1 Tax=Photobacterium kishitanii TaxID=318456 RepID=UPI00071AEBB1|nr:hypothetical protein [Photobacterium kishitanii]